MEKHEKDTEEAGCVSLMEVTKDNRSYEEGQGNKHDVLKRTGQRRLQDIVGEAGHVLRMAPECPAYSAMDWKPVDDRRRKGRPRKTWRSTFCDDLHARGVRWSKAEELVADRVH